MAHANPYLQGGWTEMAPLSPGSDGSMSPMAGSAYGGSSSPAFAPPQTSLGSLPMNPPVGVHISPLPVGNQRIFRLAFRASPAEFPVLDSGNNPVFIVSTRGQPRTSVRDARTNGLMAILEWQVPVPVLNRGGAKMLASDFLRPIRGTTARAVSTSIGECRWTSDARHFFLQRNPAPNGTVVTAAMVHGSLEIRIAEAFFIQTPNLLPECVIALLLLQGRNFVGLR